MKKDFGLLLLSSLAQTSCHGSGIVDHTTVFDSSSVNSEWIALVSNGASDRRWRKVEDVSFPASIKTRGKRDHYSEDEGARQYSEAVEVEHYVVQEKSEKDQLKDLISTPGTAGYIVFVYLGSYLALQITWIVGSILLRDVPDGLGSLSQEIEFFSTPQKVRENLLITFGHFIFSAMFLFPPLERISDAYPYLFYGDLLSQVPTDSETYSYYTPPAVTYYDSYPESSEIYHEIDSFETVYHESPQTYHDSPHTYHDSPHTYHDNSPSYHRESFPTSYHTSGYHDHGYHNHGYHDHHGHQEHHHSSYSSSIGGGGYHADFSDAPGFATKKPDAEETPTVEKETPGRFSYSGTFYTNNHGEIEFEELRLQPINHLKTNQQKDEPNSSGSNTAEQNDTRDNSLQKVASEIDTTGKAAKLDISY